MIIDLIRHGATDRDGVLLGRTDPAAAKTAWEQLARQVEGRTWTTIVASPLARSRALAERLARDRDLPLRIDGDWAELDFGDWDGRPVAELRADPAVAAHLDAFYRDADAPGPPNGECWRTLEARTARALDRLLEQEGGASALVVAHGGPMRAILSLACGLPFACTWSFRIDHGTRITLSVARGGDGRIWGEIVEVVQA